MTKFEKLQAAKLAKLTAKRNENRKRILANADDCGRFGREFELSCARPLSKKTNVSAQNRADVHILYNGKYVAAECKTNGGRVDDLLSGENKSRFVIYRLEFTQKHKATKTHDAWDEVRTISPVIIPTALFLNMLVECNALKEVRHNGIVDGIAIQPSSKRMFERLNEWPVEFHNDWEYETSDFEGLGL